MTAPPHNFPIARPNLGAMDGLSLNMSSMPFPVVRLTRNAGLGAATAGIMIGWLALVVVAQLYIHVAVTAILFLGGALALAFLWFPWVRRKTFLDRCAHMAVLSRLITHGDAGSQNPVQDARQFVTGALGHGDELDETLNATSARARMLIRRLDNLSNALPFEVPGLSGLLNGVVRMMMPFVSSIVIIYALIQSNMETRKAADDALCYVAQNGKAIMGLSLRAAFTEKLLGGTVTLLALALFGTITWFAAGAVTPSLLSSVEPERIDTAIAIANGAAVFVLAVPLALILSWIVREAFIRPGITAFVAGRFLQTIQTQAIDPQWRARIDNLEEFSRTGRVRIPIG